MSEQELWQRDCEQAADHHIRTCLEHERRQLAQRLHEAAGGRQDPIRRCLADVLISGTQYLAQLMTSSVARAEDLADDLLRLHHQLLLRDVPQEMDDAAWPECEMPQEPVPARHGSISTSAADLAKRIEAEVASESAAYRSHAKLRLMRLQSCILGWLDEASDEDAQLGAVCTELLLLCRHLGIVTPQDQHLEVRANVIRERATQLLLAEHDALHAALCDVLSAIRSWLPFDDHATSEREGDLAEHHQAEGELADVLVRLVGLLCQPDQQASPQAKREAMAYQLAKHLEPPLVPQYVAPPGSCGALIDGLLAWMTGRPTGAQMLAHAVVALPDVLQPLQSEQPGGAT